jgi:hypothetical protein
MWGSGGIAPPFLTRALDGAEWSASHHCCFTTREILSQLLQIISPRERKNIFRLFQQVLISITNLDF